RYSLTSSAGTLQVDNLPAFLFPTGVTTVMDTTAATIGLPTCQHDVHVPTFTVPNFDIPALNYCSSVTALGCESGTGVGKGKLWAAAGGSPATVPTASQPDPASPLPPSTVPTSDIPP